MPTHHPLAVIGGGLGGLTLARVLHVHGIGAAVFDREDSPAARTQGGHVHTALKTGEDWLDSLDSLDFTDPDTAKKAVLTRFEGWEDGLRKLIADADGPLVPRRIHALPVGYRWPRTPGVTLLGDAAHLMSPFAGEGANLAMLDGAELGRALAAHPDDREAALAAYEEALFPRSAASAAESDANLRLMFGDDALARLLDQFTARPRPAH